MLPAVFDFLNGPVRDLVTQIYDAVGYLGVALWVAIESVIIPIPSELVLPFAGFLVGEGVAIEPITGAAWNYWLVVLAGTIGATVGALIAYGIGAWGGRPIIERWGRYLGITTSDLDRADAVLRAARPGGQLLRPDDPDHPLARVVRRRHRPDAARAVHGLHVPRLAAMDGGARVRRCRPRSELGDDRRLAQALRVRDPGRAGHRRGRLDLVPHRQAAAGRSRRYVTPAQDRCSSGGFRDLKSR